MCVVYGLYKSELFHKNSKRYAKAVIRAHSLARSETTFQYSYVTVKLALYSEHSRTEVSGLLCIKVIEKCRSIVDFALDFGSNSN